MKQLFVSYAGYNAWANTQMLNVILSLPAEKQDMPIVSSFAGLQKTLLHMWDAESIWWQRHKLQEHVTPPSAQFTGDIKELASNIQKADKDWCDWIAAATEPMLQHEFIYYTLTKEKFKQPVLQMLLHLFNHNTYHRGQLVTILRQLGVTKIPQTDYIVWARKFEKIQTVI